MRPPFVLFLASSRRRRGRRPRGSCVVECELSDPQALDDFASAEGLREQRAELGRGSRAVGLGCRQPTDAAEAAEILERRSRQLLALS